MSSQIAAIKSVAIACVLGVLVLLASMAASYTIAQQTPGTKPDTLPSAKKQAPPSTPVPPSAPAPAAQQQNLSLSLEQTLYFIRSTLLTLNDANRSGNYSVMRDLAAPDLQARYTAADFGQMFSDLRRRKIDLHAAALLAPQLTAEPALDQSGMLHLTGYIPTRPQQINFNLVFQVVAGEWRLYGISIATPEAAPAQPQAQAPPEPVKQSEKK